MAARPGTGQRGRKTQRAQTIDLKAERIAPAEGDPARAPDLPDAMPDQAGSADSAAPPPGADDLPAAESVAPDSAPSKGEGETDSAEVIQRERDAAAADAFPAAEGSPADPGLAAETQQPEASAAAPGTTAEPARDAEGAPRLAADPALSEPFPSMPLPPDLGPEEDAGRDESATSEVARPEAIPSHQPPRAARSGLGLVLAAVLGGLVVLAGTVILVLSGAFDREIPVAGGGASSAEIDAIEAEIAALRDAAPAPADDAALTDLAARLDSVETALAALPEGTETPPVPIDTARLDALEAEVESLRGALAAAEPAPDLAPLQTRIAAVETTLATLPAPAAAPDLAPVESRLGANETALTELRTQVDALAAAPAPVDPADMTALASRVAALEGAGPDPAVAAIGDRLAALEAGTGDLAATLASIQSALDTIRGRLDAVETALADMPRANEAAVLAFAGNQLRTAVESGGPYAAELDAVAALDPAFPERAALAPSAASGVATPLALAARFDEVAPAILATEPEAVTDQGFVERLMANARSLVNLRTTDENDTSLAGIVGRIGVRLEAGDPAGALDAWRMLPEPARNAAADWGAMLEARVAADAALDAMTARQISELQQSPTMAAPAVISPAAAAPAPPQTPAP